MFKSFLRKAKKRQEQQLKAQWQGWDRTHGREKAKKVLLQKGKRYESWPEWSQCEETQDRQPSWRDPRCGRGDGSMRPLPLSAQDPVCHRRPVSEIVSCPQPCAYSFTVAVDGFMLFIWYSLTSNGSNRMIFWESNLFRFFGSFIFHLIVSMGFSSGKPGRWIHFLFFRFHLHRTRHLESS